MALGWTEERVDRLKQEWSDGLSASQIAGRLGGVTRNAVIGKVHRLGLSGRATHRGGKRGKLGSQSRARKDRRGRVLSDAILAERAALRAVAEERRQVQMGPDLEIPPSERRTILVRDKNGNLCANDAMGASACRWPIGDPQHADFGFCSHTAVIGLPYCDFHAKRAYHAIVDPPNDPVRDMQRQRRDGVEKVKHAKLHLGLGFGPMRVSAAEKAKEIA